MIDGDVCFRYIYQNTLNEYASITEFNKKTIFCLTWWYNFFFVGLKHFDMVFRHLIWQTYFDNNEKSRTTNLDFINELHHCISKQRKKILQTKKKINIATFPNKLHFYITHDYCSTGRKYNTPVQLTCIIQLYSGVTCQLTQTIITEWKWFFLSLKVKNRYSFVTFYNSHN